MYNLPYHKERNPQIIDDFIAQYPFAFITGCDDMGEPVATQIPVFMEERNGKQILRGHFMKHTDHYNAFLNNPQVLVVITGRSTYVSGTWYSNPYSPSTWNYMSVHIKGKIQFLEGLGLEEILRKTTLHFEDNNQQSTTTFDNLPPEFKQRVMHAIVGFEIEVLKLDSVFKLSQDRDYESYQRIIEKLRQKDYDGQVIASEMQNRIHSVFPGRNS